VPVDAITWISQQYQTTARMDNRDGRCNLQAAWPECVFWQETEKCTTEFTF